jgi:hypothetical protein
MKDMMQNKKNFMCIGSMCMPALILKYASQPENINHLKTPLTNTVLKDGFKGVHKLFDGTFYNEVIKNNKDIEYTYYENRKFKHHFNTLSYCFTHLNFNDEGALDKVIKRYDETLYQIKNNKDIVFLYSLNEEDVKLTKEDIEKELNVLSNYINVNNIIFLGSKKYDGKEDYVDGNYVSKNHWNYTNSIFKEVVGDRYMEIYPSNIFKFASRDFFNKLDEIYKKI